MKRIALFFALAVAAIACTPEETVTPEIKVVPAESELLLPTEGGELTIKFNTNVDWTASVKEADAKEWCSLSPATGKPGDNTLKVIALENEGTENRTVTVVITAMEATAEVVVTQLQKDALVLTGNKSFEVPYQGQNLEFAVSHNSELKATADVEWITEVKAKAVEESKFTFAVAPNTGEARTGKITFTAGSLKEVVEVKQAAWVLEFTVTPEDETKTFEAEGGEYEVTVAANVEYTVTVPENDWLTVADAEGVYTFTAAANTTPATREVTVTITPKDEKLAEAAVAIKMNQKGVGARLEVSETAAKKFTNEATTFELTISSNIEYEVTLEDCTWMSFTEAEGVYTFALSENADLNERSAIVNVIPTDAAYAGLAVAVEVYQSGRLSKTWGFDMREVLARVVTVTIAGEEVGNNVSIATWGDYVVVCASDGKGAVLLDKTTGENKGKLNTGDVVPYYVANDDAGNLVFCNRLRNWWSAPETFFSVWYMAPAATTPTELAVYNVGNGACSRLGGTLAVSGDVTKDAVLGSAFEGGGYGANALAVCEIKDGVAGAFADVKLSGFVGLGWLSGYWTDLPDYPAFDFIGTSLAEGGLMGMYDENKLYKFDGTGACVMAVETPVAGGNEALRSIDIKVVDSKPYIAMTIPTFYCSAGNVPMVVLADMTNGQVVAAPATKNYGMVNPETWEHEASTGSNVADVVIEPIQGGVNIYHIDLDCTAIEAFTYKF